MQKHLRALVWVPLLALASAYTVHADVQLPRVIGNNMVLQRDKPLPIWGWDEIGQEVTVALGEASATATAGKNGKWLVRLPAQKAGGPYPLSIRGSSVVELKNVLIGEVWIVSGQSNMEALVHQVGDPPLGPRAEIPGADLPGIRHLWIPHVMAARPLGNEGAVAGRNEVGREVVITPRPPDRAANLNDAGSGWQVSGPEAASRFTAVGYHFARKLHGELNVPVGLVTATWGGSPVEPWIAPDAMAQVKDQPMGPLTQRPHFRSSVTYNAMIHPLLPYAIRGAIWYQGESNGFEGESYLRKKRALIEGWRKAWNQGDFPFYFVQLPGYQSPTDDPQGGDGWARVREAQGKVAATVKNSGMAITIDIGEANDIHPMNKIDVGRRLALWALARDYGRKSLVHSGPLFKSMKAAGQTIELSFDHVGGGLMAARKPGPRSPEMPKPVDKLDGFAIAGADQKWHWARAIIEDDKVLVSSPEVAKPVAVRYAFSGNPVRANLYNREGLPAAPFRTDTWKFLRYRDHTMGEIVDEPGSRP